MEISSSQAWKAFLLPSTEKDGLSTLCFSAEKHVPMALPETEKGLRKNDGGSVLIQLLRAGVEVTPEDASDEEVVIRVSQRAKEVFQKRNGRGKTPSFSQMTTLWEKTVSVQPDKNDPHQLQDLPSLPKGFRLTIFLNKQEKRQLLQAPNVELFDSAQAQTPGLNPCSEAAKPDISLSGGGIDVRDAHITVPKSREISLPTNLIDTSWNKEPPSLGKRIARWAQEMFKTLANGLYQIGLYLKGAFSMSSTKKWRYVAPAEENSSPKTDSPRVEDQSGSEESGRVTT